MLKVSDGKYLEIFLTWIKQTDNRLYYVNLNENFTRENFISTLKVFNKAYFKVDIPIEDSKLNSLFELLQYNKEKI